jgi:hypothetical protein
MKNIFEFLKFENLKNALIKVIFRFPISFALIILISILFIIIIATWSSLDKNLSEIIIKIILTSIVTFFFSTSLNIFLEEFNINNLKKDLIRLIPIVFAVVFYYFLNLDSDSESVVYVALTTAWFIWFLFIWNFILDIFKNTYKENLYYNYFYKISLSFLIAFILWWVLFALWAIWIWAVITLFDIRDFLDEWDLFGYWAVFALSFTAPIFWLVNLPSKDSLDNEGFYENKFFSFLIKYVWTPFIYVYFLILYAYSIKVLVNFHDWPKWEVSWLVIWFSTFGYLIYIFSYIFEDENILIKLFRRFFPIFVIPQILMLFYAIYLRISQYDLTMNRYFVVVFWIWLLVISLYYIFSSKKYLWVISFLLSVFVLIISIWPWWVYSLPEARQYDRLISNFEKAKILNNDTITPLKEYSDIDKSLSNDIYSWIEYVCEFNNCEKIRKLFWNIISPEEEKRKKEFEENKQKYLNENPNIKADNYWEYDWMSRWEIASFLWNYLKVYNYSYDNTVMQKYININLNYNISIYPISLEGFNYIINIYSSDSTSVAPETFFLKVNVDAEKLDLVKDNNVVESFPLIDINKKIYELQKSKWVVNLNKLDLTFLIVWEKYDLKLFFRDYSILNPEYKNDSNSENSYKSISGNALVKEK